jgi:hypothetical protein
MTSVFDRALPANIDAERLALGSILLNGDRYSEVSSVLSPEDFSLEKHRRIFARMKDLFDRGESIDRLTVAEELQRQVDRAAFIFQVPNGSPKRVAAAASGHSRRRHMANDTAGLPERARNPWATTIGFAARWLRDHWIENRLLVGQVASIMLLHVQPLPM